MDLLRERLRILGHQRLRCADAPNTDGMNKAALQSSQTASDALAWYKQQYADSAPQRQAATDLATQQANLQNQLSQQELDTQQQQQQRYNTTFAPIEDKIASDAMAYDTPARREAAAAAARADVQQELTGQQQATERAMERSGVTPGSGRSMAMQGMMDLGAAKLKAGAANTARQQVETIGSAKMMDAAGLGRGVVSNQGTAAGLALTAGNSAVNNGTQPVNIAGAGAAMGGQGYSTALAGYGQAGSIYGNIANVQNQANSASNGIWGALGSVGGAALMKFSDRKMKKNIAALDGDKALDAVLKTPAYTYTYKDDSPAADGGQPHAGGMAQDLEKTMGPDVSNGHVVNVAAEQGYLIAATKALDKKISRVAAAAGIKA